MTAVGQQRREQVGMVHLLRPALPSTPCQVTGTKMRERKGPRVRASGTRGSSRRWGRVRGTRGRVWMAGRQRGRGGKGSRQRGEEGKIIYSSGTRSKPYHAAESCHPPTLISQKCLKSVTSLSIPVDWIAVARGSFMFISSYRPRTSRHTPSRVLP
jgi:hypothetical protein